MIKVGVRIFSLLAFARLASAAVQVEAGQINTANSGSPGYFPSFNAAPGPSPASRSFLSTLMPPGSGSSRRRSNDPVEYFYDGDEIIGFINHETGESRIFPNYGDLKPIEGPVDLKSAFTSLEKKGNAFPTDDLSIELVEGSKLLGSESAIDPNDEGSGSAAKRSGDGGDSVYLVVGTVRRFVELEGGHKIATCGPGSQATFSVGHGNKIFSLSHQWKSAKMDLKGDRKPLPTEDVIEQVKKKFDTKHYFGCNIKVEAIDTCLYDSGAQFLQPVYRILGRSFDPETNSTIGSNQFIEYIPIGGEALEPIPHPATDFAGANAYEPPLEPEATAISKRSFLNYFDARNAGPRITVGRYLVRNDSDGFLEDARNFWSNLSTSTIFEFIRKGLFWAYPRLYKEDANDFVNGVNVALTEGHGLFHGFSTYDGSTSFDWVNISDLAPGGYGPISNNGKGQLGYWFIDASEVMPTCTDFKALKDPNPQGRTFDPWWPVFRGGIHAILSWRTSTLFADNTAARAAKDIALGIPVVTAWLEAAQSDPAYQDKPTYTGKSTGIPDWPLGKAAAMFRCGRIGDRAHNLENLGAPNCLSVRWWDNN